MIIRSKTTIKVFIVQYILRWYIFKINITITVFFASTFSYKCTFGNPVQQFNVIVCSPKPVNYYVLVELERRRDFFTQYILSIRISYPSWNSLIRQLITRQAFTGTEGVGLSHVYCTWKINPPAIVVQYLRWWRNSPRVGRLPVWRCQQSKARWCVTPTPPFSHSPVPGRTQIRPDSQQIYDFFRLVHQYFLVR